jgi:hypothetical protein
MFRQGILGASVLDWVRTLRKGVAVSDPHSYAKPIRGYFRMKLTCTDVPSDVPFALDNFTDCEVRLASCISSR